MSDGKRENVTPEEEHKTGRKEVSQHVFDTGSNEWNPVLT